MRIRRARPRVEWTQVPNAVARDHRLSWRARGLLVELLSYPPGWETTIDELVVRARRAGDASEGRDAMRKAARELTAAGYIVRSRYQDSRGHWNTVLEVTDEPALEPPGSDQGEQASPQVAPTTEKPYVGEPGVGRPGVNKKTVKKTVKKNPPPPPSSVPHQRARADSAAADSDVERYEQAARDLLDSLPEQWRPDAVIAATIVPTIAHRLSRSWTADELRDALTANPEGLIRPVAALPRRAAALPHRAPHSDRGRKRKTCKTHSGTPLIDGECPLCRVDSPPPAAGEVSWRALRDAVDSRQGT